LEDVLREVASGNPVVVLHGYGVWPLRYWHYTVVVGYDREEGQAILRSGLRERQTMPFAVLEYTWKDSSRWAMVTSKPDRIPVSAEEGPYLEAVNAMARVADTSTSAAAYRAYLEKWPGNLTASVGLANALHSARQLREAEAVLRDALAKHPDSVVVLNNLAQTVSDEGRQKEALELIDRAVALGGDFARAAQETRQAILGRMRR
jgi:tetratricopeptide (TPR) repeat protein